ncbi:hypothetical protein CNR22_02225 [Sphingobacteriaceae bacterium]|nr:hypothetical protein CNR22_02225 [Sphingobacteriaceae bacterium]
MLVVILLIFVVILAVWYSRRSSGAPSEVLDDDTIFEPAEVEKDVNSPVGFGYKTSWFAVKSAHYEKLVQYFGLTNVREATWKAGIDAAYEDGIFISPEMDSWNLIVGNSLPSGDSKEGIKETTELLKTLSGEFGEAQFFSTHRVVEFHCWMKAVNGNMERLYSYIGESGETIAYEGKPTAIEEQFNLINTLSEEAQQKDYFGREDLTYPDEELVMLVARDWSIDPTQLDERKEPTEPGLMGRRF